MIAYRKSTKLKTFFAFLVSITFMMIWLPFLRSLLDGDSYLWGTVLYGFSYSGAGLEGDFWYLILQFLFFGTLFYSFFWLKKRLWFYGLCIAWFFLTIGNYAYQVFMMDDAMFHGDTLGVHVSLFWFVIPIGLASVIVLLLMIREDMNSEEVLIPWGPKNLKYMLLILGPLPLQALLLSTGEPHGFTDQIGVVISIIQSYLVPIFLRPFHAEAEFAQA